MNGDSAINIVNALIMVRVYLGLKRVLTGCKSGEANLVPAIFSSPFSASSGGVVGADLALGVTNSGTSVAVNSVGYIFVGF